MTIRIKICCIGSRDEAAAAQAAGVDAIGLVSAMPSGPGVIDESLIADIARGAPPELDTFLLTAHTEPDAIAAQHARCPTRTIQLVDRLAPRARHALARRLPGVRLVQVVHVGGEDAVAEAREAADGAHALLLDSGRPDAAARTLGGTGETHDWSASARIVQAAPVPVYLAGGLRAENAAAAVSIVRPHGVDVCTGVRRHGRLDAARLADFVTAVRRG